MDEHRPRFVQRFLFYILRFDRSESIHKLHARAQINGAEVKIGSVHTPWKYNIHETRARWAWPVTPTRPDGSCC